MSQETTTREDRGMTLPPKRPKEKPNSGGKGK